MIVILSAWQQRVFLMILGRDTPLGRNAPLGHKWLTGRSPGAHVWICVVQMMRSKRLRTVKSIRRTIKKTNPSEFFPSYPVFKCRERSRCRHSALIDRRPLASWYSGMADRTFITSTANHSIRDRPCTPRTRVYMYVSTTTTVFGDAIQYQSLGWPRPAGTAKARWGRQPGLCAAVVVVVL